MLQLLRSKNFFPSVRLHFLTERKQMYIFFKIMAHDKYCFFFSAQNLHSWFVERTISEMMHTSIALDWLQINLNFSWTSCKAVLKGTGCLPNYSKINILLEHDKVDSASYYDNMVLKYCLEILIPNGVLKVTAIIRVVFGHLIHKRNMKQSFVNTRTFVFDYIKDNISPLSDKKFKSCLSYYLVTQILRNHQRL